MSSPSKKNKLGVLLLHDGKRRRNIAGDLDAVVLARRAEQKLEIGEALRVLSFGESRSKNWNLKYEVSSIEYHTFSANVRTMPNQSDTTARQ